MSLMDKTLSTPIPDKLLSLIAQLYYTHCSAEFPPAYEITFACYGSRLYGHESGSVDRRHNLPGAPCLPACRKRVEAIRSRLREPVFLLTPPYRRSVLDAIIQTSRFRGWIPLAVHVRSNHVHAVVHGLVRPERIMNDLKSYATRALKERHGVNRRRTWARHGSNPYLWTLEDVETTVRYVLYGQGRPMETYFATELPVRRIDRKRE